MDYNLKELEDYRQQVMKKSRVFFYASIPCFIIAIILFVIIFVLDNAPEILFYLAFILVAVGIVLVAIGSTKKNKCRSEIKSTLITALLKKHCGDDVVYNEKATLPELNEIISLGFVQRPDRVEGGDYYSAVYNNIRFSCSDINLEERHETTDSKGNKTVSYISYYKGRMLVFNLESLPQNMHFIEKGSCVRGLRGVEKVQTEISLLNEKYRIGVENKEEIFHYLTPVVLQGFINFEEMVGGIISYIFYNDKLYLFIQNCPDSLEIRMNKPLDETEVNYILGGLRLPLEIIESFKLNDKFFKKK